MTIYDCLLSLNLFTNNFLDISGTVETLQESLIEVTSGQAKYEHHHRAIVWRCPRLPKEGQGMVFNFS